MHSNLNPTPIQDFWENAGNSFADNTFGIAYCSAKVRQVWGEGVFACPQCSILILLTGLHNRRRQRYNLRCDRIVLEGAARGDVGLLAAICKGYVMKKCYLFAYFYGNGQ